LVRFSIKYFILNFFANFSLQNVISKILISDEHYRYTALELQVWASLLACVFQIPLLIYYVDIPLALQLTSKTLIFLYIFNGFCYHIQSVAAFAIMAYISPITHR
jgi:solute carrier family 35 protein E2